MVRTSVETTAWQLLALKSAHMAYLNVPKDTVLATQKFLDDVQLDEGRAYPGTDGKREHRATAAGLYSRAMLGWKRSNAKLSDGLAVIGRNGPQEHDAVANYFAHQLHHFAMGGAWPRWNDAMRKQLLDSHAREGEHAGSWHDAKDSSAARGGRVMQTALHVMLLNIVVRGHDMLRDPDGEDEFEL